MSTPFELVNKEGDPIRGDLWAGDDPKPDAAIVICHGFKGFKNWGFFPYVCEELARRTGYPVISFNFSGNGVGADLLNFTELDKFERNTFSKELDDLALVLDAAEVGELPGLPSRVEFGLLGHSRGGLSAVVTAAEDGRVKAVVTWAAVASLDRWPDEKKAEWRRNGRIEILNARTRQMMPLGVALLDDFEANAERLDIQKAASRLEVPYLIIHGSEDESVRVEEAGTLYAAAPEGGARLERIEGAGHTFGAVHPFAGPTDDLAKVVGLSADWFAEHLDD